MKETFPINNEAPKGNTVDERAGESVLAQNLHLRKEEANAVGAVEYWQRELDDALKYGELDNKPDFLCHFDSATSAMDYLDYVDESIPKAKKGLKRAKKRLKTIKGDILTFAGCSENMNYLHQDALNAHRWRGYEVPPEYPESAEEKLARIEEERDRVNGSIYGFERAGLDTTQLEESLGRINERLERQRELIQEQESHRG